MKPHIHYNPDHTAAPMADKTTIRLLIAAAAAGPYAIGHFDMTSAYLHEKYHFDKPVYVRQYPQFDGHMKHEGKCGILL